MFIISIYIIVIAIATILGSMAGIGGGVIIKPVLDLIGYHDVSTISFLSSWAVFSMAVYSTIKQIKNGISFDWRLIGFIAIGATIGGLIGNTIFNYLLSIVDPTIVKVIQALILSGLLLLVIINTYSTRSLHIQKQSMFLIVGLLLGCISSFLGIGGGPINVAVFTFFFSLDLKKAMIYSIATIIFSQASKLLTIAFTTGYGIYDCSLLLYMIPTAIVGGMIGTYLNKKIEIEKIQKVFSRTVLLIIFINIITVIKDIF